ncbi:Predicted dehydrogenase [Streptomyces sp. DvalAA-14]|uniref:Gfo/Idh/MocA family protein n=1 Tax=unclassified Streptomyces TaxID=2593676 RepID=UPI00081B4229|nr:MULTISPECIES: Gfo/Idh/MocA family oxidoreductase [unclassified Streptomyces]MYS21084.1 Gfo/Idh/MocA family oxidoreductase [Streptomyces sp. SID4948]SCD83807.1 Predicted dehydrogenase [Streptomyces sp. DvalAA-14]
MEDAADTAGDELSAVVIGAGSQGRVHALGYLAAPGVALTALADVDQRSAESLAAELEVPGVHRDYRELLAAARPDIVSVCTPPALHPEVVKAAVAAGARAVHCEKPIALSYGEALEMAATAADAGVQLTFNLQRRFDPVQRQAREWIAQGEIGDVVTIEGYCPNLFDWGTHILDLVLFHRQDAAPQWVLGQIDASVDRYVYGVFTETASLTQIGWADGVRAVVSTGREPHTSVLNLENDLGLIVQGTRGRADLRGARGLLRRFGKDDLVHTSPFDTDVRHWDRGVDPAITAGTAEAIRDLVASLRTGRRPALHAEYGLRGAELVFATYESSRSRRRVPLPLDRLDNALISGRAEGYWSPTGELRSTY